MIELERIETGGQDSCQHYPAGTALVHACKSCHSKLCGQPAKDAADYLFAEDDGELYLNMIDPKTPLFRLDLFRKALDWMERRWKDGQTVVIHCDQGQSRSRSLALLLAARVGLIPSSGFFPAAATFSAQTGRPFRPSAGIVLFMQSHWREIVEAEVIRAKAPPRVSLAPITQTLPRWEKSGAKEVADERALHGGYTLAELDEISEDVALLAKGFLKIPERVSKEPIAFEPSPLQDRMFSHYRLCQGRQDPCRMVVPKIRRGGGSTGAEAIMYTHAHNYNARIGSIGTDDTVSKNMFEMVRFFDKHDSFPGWGRATKILETGEMTWANGSKWESYTAERPDAARSAGLQGYHGSEIGRWQEGGAKDAKETLRSMLGAVPRRGFTVVIEESTAQGASGAFYERFQSARWPTAEELGCAEGCEFWRKWADETPQNIAQSEAERRLQFVRIFAAWFEDDENRPETGCSGSEEAYIRATLDVKERKLIARYRTIGPQGERLGDTAQRATLWEQLAWRRSVIATEFDGDEDGFEQENPSSPAEAFASSGRHTFNRAGCAWMVETSKSRTPRIGVLERQAKDDKVLFRDTDRATAWFQMWEEPRIGHRYLFGFDTMGGRSHSKNLKQADFNAGIGLRAPHIDTTTGEKRPAFVMASLMPGNQDDPDILAAKADLASDFYGGCLVVHEDNNTGAGFRQEAMRLGMNLYRRVETDKYTAEQTEYIGWVTTPETRPQLFATGKRHIRNNANEGTRPDGVQCWDLTTATQAQECVLGDDGKDAAPGSKHDDNLLAFLIGLHCIGGATIYAGHRRKRTGPNDRSLWRSGR